MIQVYSNKFFVSVRLHRNIVLCQNFNLENQLNYDTYFTKKYVWITITLCVQEVIRCRILTSLAGSPCVVIVYV